MKETDIQRAVLFSVCGAATYKLIKNLLAPANPTEVEFKDIVKLLIEHYQPKTFQSGAASLIQFVCLQAG